ncbi:MAG TPA: hypothetical protein VFM77_11085 [Terriglobales bacterium]|nr:hypothetical protein [Terriglobales bacterium]
MARLEISTAARWRAWRRLHPVYCALAREFVLEIPPCDDLAAVIEIPSAENVAEAEKWFAAMDAHIHIHHLRHFAQTSPLMSEEAITDFLLHSLSKPQRTADDRDKVDFLVVQLVAMRLPPRTAEPEITVASIMKLLEPAVGPANGEAPKFVTELESMVAEMDSAKSLNVFFTSRILERSREIKQSSGEHFFQPLALAAFARFGYLIRRRFFQLMQQDLNTTLDGLRELEARGVATIDCRKAQFSADEPLTRIRMICQSWRVMFQAEYSSGQPLCLLVDLKTAIEQALTQTKSLPTPKPASVGASAGIHR